MSSWYFCLEPGTLEIVDRFEGTEEDVQSRSSRLEFVKLDVGVDPRVVDLSRDDSGNVVVSVNDEKVTKLNDDVRQFNLIQLRRKRDILLQKCDWVVSVSDSPLTQEKTDEWKVYRQALRDLPSTTEDFENPTWPSVPE
tara:strand:+ start:1910 stop:2326 length:417 start_codon:yes stop_codon:yes gene_type:complete